jgi:hypothetical protein
MAGGEQWPVIGACQLRLGQTPAILAHASFLYLI